MLVVVVKDFYTGAEEAMASNSYAFVRTYHTIAVEIATFANLEVSVTVCLKVTERSEFTVVPYCNSTFIECT